MRTKPKFIDLAKLANDKTGEARAMLRELEGTPKAKHPSEVRWPSRFASVGFSKLRALRAAD